VPPLSLVISVVALFKEEKKGFALAGTVISVLAFLILLLPSLCDWETMW
jgi:hypothetical protein